MERLIESVRKYPCLWKLDSVQYKLNDFKEAAWKEVVKECNLPDVKEARALWKKLRDSHRQAVSKKKTITSPAGTLKPSWKYEKQMEFLLPHMKNRLSPTNEVLLQKQNSNRKEPRQNEESCDSVDQLYCDLVPPKRKKTSVSVLEMEQRIREQRSLKRNTIRKQITLSCKDTTADTPIGNFFMSMLLTTQTLPERIQVRIQRQVFNIVMDAREEYLVPQDIIR